MLVFFLALAHHSSTILEERDFISFISFSFVQHFATKILPSATQTKYFLQHNPAFPTVVYIIATSAERMCPASQGYPAETSVGRHRRQLPMLQGGCRTNSSLRWDLSAQVKKKTSWTNNSKAAQHRLPLPAVVRVLDIKMTLLLRAAGTVQQQ